MKNVLTYLSNQLYYHNGVLRLVYPALFGSSEIVLSVDRDQAEDIENKMEDGVLELADFTQFRETSEMVNVMFQMISLNQMFQDQDGRFLLSMEENNVFLTVNGAKVPAPLPNGLWQNIMAAIEAENDRDVLAYVRFFAQIQQNAYKSVRESVMDFLRMKGEQYCITEAGNLLAFKQLRFYSAGNQIHRDAVALKPIVSNKIKKSVNDVNMFYLDGEAQLTEGSFELIANRYPSNHTVQWIGSVAFALSLNPDLDTYTDGWTGNMRIVEGLEVREPLQHVVTDPNKTCVKGLHFYPLNWNNKKFYSNGMKLFLIEVNPTDICAIPNQKNYDKSRGSAYTLSTMLETNENGEIQIPEIYSNGIIYGTDGLNLDEEFNFPNLEDDISTFFVLPEPEVSQRFDITWDEDDEDEDGWYDEGW